MISNNGSSMLKFHLPKSSRSPNHPLSDLYILEHPFHACSPDKKRSSLAMPIITRDKRGKRARESSDEVEDPDI
jgi:hypothetical protein